MDLRGKCSIVTGGTVGIGKAIARQLAQRGSNLFLIARRQELLESTLADIRSEVSDPSQRFGCFSADIADAEAVGRAIAAAEKECGNIAVLVNSAGSYHPGYVEKLPLSDIETDLRVNYFGTVYPIKAVLEGMMERRQGWILNISSLAGLKGYFGYSAYAGSKFAVVGFSEAMRSELRPWGVTVSLLCPPNVETETFHDHDEDVPLETKKINEMGSFMQPEDVATAAIEGLRRGSFVIIPDRGGRLLMLANRLAPSLFDWFLERAIARGRAERGL